MLCTDAEGSCAAVASDEAAEALSKPGDEKTLLPYRTHVAKARSLAGARQSVAGCGWVVGEVSRGRTRGAPGLLGLLGDEGPRGNSFCDLRLLLPLHKKPRQPQGVTSSWAETLCGDCRGLPTC